MTVCENSLRSVDVVVFVLMVNRITFELSIVTVLIYENVLNWHELFIGIDRKIKAPTACDRK